MDRFTQMQVFVAVAETQGFSSGARKIGVSAPVVTRAISHLETHLRVKLFIRTTRHVRLTEAGAAYLAHAKKILDDIQQADETVAGLNGKASGHLTITASALFGEKFVLPIIVDYLNEFPDTKVSALFLDRIVNLAEEGVDVGIRIGNLPDSSLRAARVGSVKRVVVASPNYLQRNGSPNKPDDLRDHTTISASRLNSNVEWKFRDNSSVRIDPRFNVTTNSAAIEAASLGHGITRVMSYQVSKQVRTGELEVILADYEDIEFPVHVLHREGRYSSAKTRTFVDSIVAHLRSLPELNYNH